VILAAVAAFALASSAPAADRQTLASYCSPSGDVCYGIVKRSGVVRFEITTAARYFARYRLCVTPPGGTAACGSFPVFRGRFGTWYGSVRFRPTFPVPRRGVYRVSWRLGATALGPTLRLRV
jgi:hypothetical protein